MRRGFQNSGAATDGGRLPAGRARSGQPSAPDRSRHAARGARGRRRDDGCVEFAGVKPAGELDVVARGLDRCINDLDLIFDMLNLGKLGAVVLRQVRSHHMRVPIVWQPDNIGAAVMIASAVVWSRLAESANAVRSASGRLRT